MQRNGYNPLVCIASRQLVRKNNVAKFALVVKIMRSFFLSRRAIFERVEVESAKVVPP